LPQITPPEPSHGVITAVSSTGPEKLNHQFLTEVSDMVAAPLITEGARTVTKTFARMTDEEPYYKSTHHISCLVDVPYKDVMLPAVLTYKDGVIKAEILNTDISVSSEKDEFQTKMQEHGVDCIKRVYTALAEECLKPEHEAEIAKLDPDTLYPLPAGYSLDDMEYHEELNQDDPERE
jgi:hypothetical protein